MENLRTVCEYRRGEAVRTALHSRREPPRAPLVPGLLVPVPHLRIRLEREVERCRRAVGVLHRLREMGAAFQHLVRTAVYPGMNIGRRKGELCPTLTIWR